jgi:hypothetical protein
MSQQHTHICHTNTHTYVTPIHTYVTLTLTYASHQYTHTCNTKHKKQEHTGVTYHRHSQPSTNQSKQYAERLDTAASWNPLQGNPLGIATVCLGAIMGAVLACIGVRWFVKRRQRQVCVCVYVCMCICVFVCMYGKRAFVCKG